MAYTPICGRFSCARMPSPMGLWQAGRARNRFVQGKDIPLVWTDTGHAVRATEHDPIKRAQEGGSWRRGLRRW